jgi:hypothetical protein
MRGANGAREHHGNSVPGIREPPKSKYELFLGTSEYTLFSLGNLSGRFSVVLAFSANTTSAKQTAQKYWVSFLHFFRVFTIIVTPLIRRVPVYWAFETCGNVTTTLIIKTTKSQQAQALNAPAS